ncbi:MAG: hypothetical protein PHX07_06725 [Candidatus Marinimicrobia bacterium]|nr:hypothetical protein [Candidatus Neomarinimicrobiota bacterium]
MNKNNSQGSFPLIRSLRLWQIHLNIPREKQWIAMDIEKEKERAWRILQKKIRRRRKALEKLEKRRGIITLDDTEQLYLEQYYKKIGEIIQKDRQN